MATTGAEPRRWPRLLRTLLAVGFIAALGTLLLRHARGIDWSAVLDSLRAYDAGRLTAAAGLAALSVTLVGSFDLFGRKLVGHDLPAARAWTIGATSYAFNLNLGAVLGGFGMRLRLYSRHGLDTGTIARVIATSVATNWFGYLAVAGLAFASGAIEVPDGWRIGDAALRLIGAAMLATFASILIAVARSRRRSWSILGHELPVPSLRMALVQAGVSSANWLIIAALMYLLLAGRVPLPTVTAVILIAAVAGVLTHVPAGLGVLETVFVVLLADRIPAHELIAALLAYRAIYYLMPLAIALVAWPLLETSAPAPHAPAPEGAAP